VDQGQIFTSQVQVSVDHHHRAVPQDSLQGERVSAIQEIQD
jgi:hypothetical protein